MSEFYEISLNRLGLQEVALQHKALVRLAKIYQEKYSINIKIGAGEAGDASGSLDVNFSQMQNGEVRGLLYCGYEDGKKEIGHSSPFILMKNELGENILVVFSGYHAYSKIKSKFVMVEGYVNNQADASSCAMFSIHALKHALLDLQFMDLVKKGEKEVSLPKMLLTQHSKNFDEMLGQKEREIYVFEFEDKQVNLKAFYKCHKVLAEVLEGEELAKYQASIGGRTKEVIAKIDERRTKYREANAAQGEGGLQLSGAVKFVQTGVATKTLF